MARRRTPRRVAAVAVALLGLFVAGNQGIAFGAVTARATSATRTVSSGTFAVVPTLLTSGTPPAAPAALTFTVGTPRAYFDAVNTGSINLVGASYNINLVYAGTGTASVALDSCPGGTWNQTTNLCSTSPVSIGSWPSANSSYTASTQVPAAPGDRLRLRATVTVSVGGVWVSATGTANVQVSSGPTRQIRAAVTTNS